MRKDKDRLIAELIDLLGELGADERDVVELLISCGYSISEAAEYYFGSSESYE